VVIVDSSPFEYFCVAFLSHIVHHGMEVICNDIKVAFPTLIFYRMTCAKMKFTWIHFELKESELLTWVFNELICSF
jgi:hypothetical protein